MKVVMMMTMTTKKRKNKIVMTMKKRKNTIVMTMKKRKNKMVMMMAKNKREDENKTTACVYVMLEIFPWVNEVV